MKIKSVDLMALVGASTVQAGINWNRAGLATPSRTDAGLATATFLAVSGIGYLNNLRKAGWKSTSSFENQIESQWRIITHSFTPEGSSDALQAQFRLEDQSRKEVGQTRTHFFWNTVEKKEVAVQTLTALPQSSSAAIANYAKINNLSCETTEDDTEKLTTKRVVSTAINFESSTSTITRYPAWGRIGVASAAALVAVAGRLAYTRTR